MTPIRLVIPGPPVPWARNDARVGWPSLAQFYGWCRSAKDERGLYHTLRKLVHARVYRPEQGADAQYKQAIRLVARSKYRGPLLERPLRLTVDFVFPRHADKIWKTKPMPAYPHATKPDVDNLIKACADALTGTIWVDDGLVCEQTAYARHAAGGENPKTVVEVGDPSAEFWRRAGVETLFATTTGGE